MKINQIKTGAILSYFIIALNTIVGLIYTPYMLRKMGQSEYGLYSLIASVISYLTILDFGFGNTIIRYTAKFKAEGKTEEQYNMFGMFVLLYSIIALFSVFGGFILYANVDKMFGTKMTVLELHQAKILMLILTFNLATTFIFSIYGSIITAYEKFVFAKTLIILRIVLQTITMVIILEHGFKSVGMAIIVTAFNLLSLVVNALYCKFKIKIKIIFNKFEWKFLKEISSFSFWIFLNAIIDRIYWGAGQFILGIYAGTKSIAIYSLAIQFESMFTNFSYAISSVLLPKTVQIVAKESNNTKAISDFFIKTGRIQYIIILLILFGFFLFGQQFVNFWAGKNYQDVYTITLIFLIPLTFTSIQGVGYNILQAQNKLKFRSIVNLMTAIISIFISIPLTKLFGYYGCTISVALSLLIGHVIIMNFYYSREMHICIKQFWLEIIKMSYLPITLTVIFYFVMKYVNLQNLYYFGFSILLFIFCYILIIRYFIANKYEIDLIFNPIEKRLKKYIKNE